MHLQLHRSVASLRNQAWHHCSKHAVVCKSRYLNPRSKTMPNKTCLAKSGNVIKTSQLVHKGQHTFIHGYALKRKRVGMNARDAVLPPNKGTLLHNKQTTHIPYEVCCGFSSKGLGLDVQCYVLLTDCDRDRQRMKS